MLAKLSRRQLFFVALGGKSTNDEHDEQPVQEQGNGARIDTYAAQKDLTGSDHRFDKLADSSSSQDVLGDHFADIASWLGHARLLSIAVEHALRRAHRDAHDA